MNKIVGLALGLVGLVAIGVAGRAVLSRREMQNLQSFAFELLKQEHPDWAPRRVGDNGIELRAHGAIANIYLNNILRDAGPDRPRARALIEQSVAALQRQFEMVDRGVTLPPLAAAESHLRPVLVPRKYAEDYGLAARPFVADVVEALVIDAPHDTRYVRPRDLQTWQVAFDGERQQAEAALWRASQLLQLAAEPPKDPTLPGKFLSIATGDGYDAARLALPEIRAELGKQLGYPFFAAVPNQDFCIAWSKDYAFAEQFAEKVRRDFATQSHPISPLVFRVEADRIELAQ